MKVVNEAIFQRAVEGLLQTDGFRGIAKVVSVPQAYLAEVVWTSPHEIYSLRDFPSTAFKDATSEATTNARSFDGLNRALALRLHKDYPLNKEMRDWIAGVLFGTISRPPSAGGNDMLSGAIKRMMVCQLVQHACEVGLKATRSEASPPHSACDAVVEALRRVGHHTTYDAVAKSWTKFAQEWTKK